MKYLRILLFALLAVSIAAFGVAKVQEIIGDQMFVRWKNS